MAENITKEHLKKIGERMKLIRAELNLSHQEIQDELELPGATMSRLETGKGIQVLNLLKLISKLDSEHYNVKWFLLYDNSKEFKKNEDNLSQFTFNRKEFLEQNNKVIEESLKLKALASKIK